MTEKQAHLSFYSPDTFLQFTETSGLPGHGIVHIRDRSRDPMLIAHTLSHLPNVNVMWVVPDAVRRDRCIRVTGLAECVEFRRLGECIVTYEEARELLSAETYLLPVAPVFFLEAAAMNKRHLEMFRQLAPQARFIETRTFKRDFRAEHLH